MKITARFWLRAAKKKKIQFKNCIIASGSRSTMLPNLPVGHPSILTSKTALDLDSAPKSLLIIGGGIIGLELGQVYSTLGSDVSVVEYMPTLVPGADDDITKPLIRKLRKHFKSIMLSSKVTNVDVSHVGAVKVSIEKDNETIEQTYEKVLVAVGRKPNTDMLKLEETQVKTNDKGFIIVDEYQKTSVNGIYAIGDIAGNPMLAHKATHEGKVAAEVCSGLPAAMDSKAIPSVVYTDPEVAWVGLTEKEAKDKGIAYEIGDFPWAASGKAMILNAAQGKTKVLFDPETKRVLGGAVVGPSAGDLISEVCLALEMGSDVEDIALTVHPHPTLGETVGAAAEVLEGTMTDLFIPSKRSNVTKLLVLILTAFSFLYPQETKAQNDQKAPSSETKKQEKPNKKTIEEVLKNTIEKAGLFNLYQDTTSGKTYMLIKKDQLNKEYIHFVHGLNGQLNAGVFKGSYRGAKIFKLKKYFNRVEFEVQNNAMYFDPTNPLSRSADANVSSAILASSKILSEKNSEYLIDVDNIFLTESIHQISRGFIPGGVNKNPFKLGKLASERTKYLNIKNYPENTDVIVQYVYTNPMPTNWGSDVGLTDPRSVNVTLQHSFIQVPENNYKPRFEDPRVGYFATQQTDMTSADDPTPYRDMIHRWHLEKKILVNLNQP